MTATFISSLLAVLSPIIVSWLTQLAKKLMPYLLQIHNGWLVLIVSVLSYIAAIGQSALTGQPVDAGSITTLSSAILNLVGASGVYFLAQKFLPAAPAAASTPQ